MSQKRAKGNLEKEGGVLKRPRVNTVSSDSEADHIDHGDTENENTALSESDVGIIEHIVLKNFMCHSHLDFKFGTNVNFIVGRNGSGKSAVLTATVIGLGGSANCTNRGSSVKTFIQNGKQFSEITIKLNNTGEDAFKRKEYHNAIYVVRRFSSTGVSDYKLLNEHKKIVSKKKEELNHILDHFNIQIDNPLCVLNQDASRKFLQSYDPENFYKLFLKATQLAQMKDDYESIHTKKKRASIVLGHKMEAIPKLEKEEMDLRKKLDILKSLDKFRDKKLTLNCELAWSQVVAMEKDLNLVNHELDSLAKEEEKLISKVALSEEKVNSCKTKHSETQGEIQQIKQDLMNLKTTLDELRADTTLKNTQHRNAMLEAQKINYNIKQVSSERDELIKRKEEVENGDNDDLLKQKQLRLEQVDDLKTKRAELEEQYRHAEAVAQQHKSTILETRSQLNELKQKEGNVQRHLEGSRRKLVNLENSRTNYVKLFGDWVPDALAQIDEAYRQKRFKQKPLGPIGAFVKVADLRWNLAIENCIKSLLFAFCCDNHQDERVLEAILKQLVQSRRGTMPTILTSTFSYSVYNVQEHCVKSDKYPKLLDMLRIDNPIITNCIIDQAGVERILLIENPSEARQVMQLNPPKNCSMTYTIEGDQVYPSPKFRIYSSQKDKASILQENIEGVICRVRDECATLEAEHQMLRKQVSDLENQYSTATRSVKASDSKLMHLEQNKHRLSREIKELESIEDPEPMQVASMEEDLREISSNLGALENNLKLCQDNASKLKEEYNQAIQKRREIEEKRNVIIQSTLDPLKETFSTFEEEKTNAINEHKKFVEQLNKNHSEVVALSNQAKDLQTDIQKYTPLCEKNVGLRPAKIGKKEDIMREMKRINEVLANRNSMYGDETELTERFTAVHKKVAQIKEDAKILGSFCERVKNSLQHRDEYYLHLRNHLSVKIKQHFTGFLSQRDYSGTLEFNHDKGQLHVSVKTKPNDVHKDTEVKALSGGERSFSTVSFVLALWDSIESPFRMMDEFDVFMDMVNRRISMEMILRSARSNVSKQFIFLTPLDMNYLKSNEHTRIFKMRDPDRSQAVLASQTNSSDNVEEESST